MAWLRTRRAAKAATALCRQVVRRMGAAPNTLEAIYLAALKADSTTPQCLKRCPLARTTGPHRPSWSGPRLSRLNRLHHQVDGARSEAP